MAADPLGPPYAPPRVDGPRDRRGNLRTAMALLEAAGYVVRGERMVAAATGRPLSFEIMLKSRAEERVALAFADQLRRLGIETSLRLVDSAQYRARAEDYDYDMMIHHWIVTLSPGLEQDFYWGRWGVETPGTRNYPGVDDPAVDTLIGRLGNAPDRETLVAAAKALDRLLLHGRYTVPLYYSPVDYWAYWGPLRQNDVPALYGTVFEAFWWEG